MAIKNQRTIDILTWIARLVVGGVFLFSGFAKAIDPWGTLYKVDAYLASLSLGIWPNLELVGVFGLCALEFGTGIFLITGALRRTTAIVAAAIMAFMLPLTLWIAISNPVDDCGCFGDVLHLSNWATFWKNVVISAFILVLLKYNSKVHWLVTPALQWMEIVATAVFIFTIEIFGYVSQPLIDFRPYGIGKPLVNSENLHNDSPSFIFIYEKNGQQKEFKETDELPDEDDGWVYVDRKELPVEGNQPQRDDSDFRVWDENGIEDLTEEALPETGKELILMIPSLGEVSPATTWKINSLYEWAEKNDVKMIGVVSGIPREIEEWTDLSMASYPIYTAEDTQIKEVVRGNPGIVYLEDGTIVWKSTLAAINIDDFMSPETSNDANSFGRDNPRILANCASVYFVVMSLLVFLSFAPSFKKFFLRSRRDLTHDDKAPHEESSSPDKPVQ